MLLHPACLIACSKLCQLCCRYVHFYVFNITNVEEVQFGGKPALQQLGPYTYTKHSRKLDARFDMAGRVHFKPYTFYTVSSACVTPGRGGLDVWLKC